MQFNRAIAMISSYLHPKVIQFLGIVIGPGFWAELEGQRFFDPRAMGGQPIALADHREVAHPGYCCC